MTVELTTRLNQNTSIKVHGESPMDIFEQLALYSEVFSERCCGKCKGEVLSCVVRLARKKDKTYKYPELHCKTCGAKLHFGQKEDGVLFPIRYKRGPDENGDTHYLKDAAGQNIVKGTWGWVKWDADKKEEV